MADLIIEQRSGLGLAAIMARKGIGADRIGTALGIAAPERPALVRGSDGLGLIGTGAGTWLAHADQVPPLWADSLRDRLAGLASVSDQSDGYVVFRLSGPGARTVLQRGAAIDFHPDAFGPGSAATTVIAHIGAIIWQDDAGPACHGGTEVPSPAITPAITLDVIREGAAVPSCYHVAVFRSLADSFRRWLDHAAAAL